MSVRTLAIELAQNPERFSEPPKIFEVPGDAKLEADAHLVLCISGIVDRLVESEVHQQRFLARFSKQVTDGSDALFNTGVDPKVANDAFIDAFELVYRVSAPYSEVLQTPVGLKTTLVCSAYADVCDNYVAKEGLPVEQKPFHSTYRNPDLLISAGMSTFSNVLADTLTRLSMSDAPVEEKLARLNRIAKPAQQLGSLSINQARQLDPEDEEREFDGAHDMVSARQVSEYANDQDVVLRPRNMCPALPALPKSELMAAGSSIEKLTTLAAKLIILTNLHALRDNRPEAAILGYGPYHAYVEQGYTDV